MEGNPQNFVLPYIAETPDVDILGSQIKEKIAATTFEQDPSFSVERQGLSTETKQQVLDEFEQPGHLKNQTRLLKTETYHSGVKFEKANETKFSLHNIVKVETDSVKCDTDHVTLETRQVRKEGWQFESSFLDNTEREELRCIAALRAKVEANSLTLHARIVEHEGSETEHTDSLEALSQSLNPDYRVKSSKFQERGAHQWLTTQSGVDYKDLDKNTSLLTPACSLFTQGLTDCEESQSCKDFTHWWKENYSSENILVTKESSRFGTYSQRFHLEDSLNEQKHNHLHVSLQLYTCDLCNGSFPNWQHLIKHINLHLKRSTWVAGYAQSKETSQVNLYQYKQSCGKYFPQKHAFIPSSITPSQFQSLSCNMCNCKKSFTDKIMLDKHMITHSRCKPFSCDVCCKGFTSKRNLNVHKLRHYGIKLFSCDVCSKGFATKCGLDRHKMTHLRFKPFICDVCNRGFSSKSYLNIHKMSHLGLQLVSSDEYSKTNNFDSESYFNIHKMSHPELKPFICTVCSKSFTTTGNLNRHKLTHSAIKPLECDECGKSFTWKSSFRRHKMIHAGLKPFSCDICSKNFTTKSKMINHRTTHFAHPCRSKSFQCNVCSKLFTSKGNLNRHKLTHSEHKPR